MATWKKVIVSGSNISQLNNDSGYLASAGAGIISGSEQIEANISGSSTALSASIASRVTTEENNVDLLQAHQTNIHAFTSSADGEITALMAFTASGARASAISGSITTFSSSIAGRVTTEENNVDLLEAHVSNIHTFTSSADGEITSLMAFTASAARGSAISGSVTVVSASLADRITDQETFSSSLDTTFATDAEIATATASLSSSLAPDIATNKNDITALDGEVTNLMAATGSQYAHITNLNAFTASAARNTAISGSSTALSASIASDVATNKNNATALDGEVTNLMAATGSQYAHIASINAFTASAGRRSAITGSSTALSGSVAGRLTAVEAVSTTEGLLSSSAQIATNISGSSTVLSSSLAGRVTTNETEIDALQAFSQSVDAALDFDGTNVTVTGNLTVAGTQTAVDSNVLDIGDNIIALNGTGATKGGLAVNDADGPASGSLLWDGTNNYWVAGATGSEVKILRATGDGILSGSEQIEDNISGSFTALSSSIATRVTTNEVNDAKLDAEVTSLMGATGSAYAHIDNLNDFTASAGRRSAISGSFTTISGSFAGRITATDATATALDGEVTSLMAFTGSAGRRSAISGSFTAASASIASDIASISTTFNVDANSGTADAIASDETLTFTGAGPITTAVSANEITIDVNDALISGSSTALSSSIAGRLATIEAVDSATDAEVVALMAATGSQYAHIANLNTKTGSIETDVTALESFSSSLSSTVISYTGSFAGDGSSLTGITVDQTATVSSSFANALTASITHNFNTDNINVVVYEGDYQIIPSAIFAKTQDVVELHFGTSTSGRAVVMRGGHIVSGSIPFANIIDMPSVVSGSIQIATDISGSFTATSASIASDIASISTTFTIDGDSGTSNALDSGETLTIGGSGPIVTTVSTNAITIDVTDSVISGSFTAASASIASDIAGISTSFTLAADSGTNDTFNSSETLTFAGTANEVNTTVTNNQIQIGLPDDVTIGGALTVTGDLTVTGNTIEQQVTNLNVEDQFILLNSGSAAQDAGFVVNGQGAALGWDESENRFALDFAGATWNQTSITSDAYIAAVVTSEDANYAKNGNIRIDGDDIYIYS